MTLFDLTVQLKEEWRRPTLAAGISQQTGRTGGGERDHRPARVRGERRNRHDR